MQLDDILHNATDQDKGSELELANPFTGEPTGLKLWIVGPDSLTAHRAQLELSDELAELADNEGRVSAEHRDKARLNALAKHVIRWEVSEADKPVPFNTKNILTLIRVNWVQQQVDAFAGDRSNFKSEVA